MRRLLWPLLLAGCAAAPKPPASPLDALCEEYWQHHLRNNPTSASYDGDRRYEDRLPDYGPEARERHRRDRLGFLERLRTIAPASETERVTADILRRTLEDANESDLHKFHQWDVDQMGGPHIWIFELVEYHPLQDEAGRASFRKRLEAFPKLIDDYIGSLREGLREGRVATRGAVDRVVGQLKERLAAPVKDWPLSVQGTDPVERAVKPALAKLLAFLEKEYVPREAVGLSALPGGAEAYRYLIRHHTTVDHSAEELHRIGLEEMESIEAEMRAIAKTGDLKAFRERLMSDRKNFAGSREEYLEGFRAILRKVDERLPRYFARLPKTPYVVKAIEEYREADCVAAFYYGAPEDGSRPGIFYANCHRPETRPRYNMAALAVHEAVPGHHLQIAFAKEMKGLPAFRRHGWFTAYGEGWALYTERLAVEMGIYEDDLERYGMLTYQAWRAARLVVDTGMHALGWPRDKAIQYFRDHLALSENEIVNEIDRYIIWPGQALAYKVGQREIQALRAKAERELGAKFDLGQFHDAVLRQGNVPLSTLRMLIGEWIASVK